MGGAISISKCCQDSASEDTKSSAFKVVDGVARVGSSGNTTAQTDEDAFDVEEIAVPSQQDAFGNFKCKEGTERCTITGEKIVVTAEERRISDMSVSLVRMDSILLGLIQEEDEENRHGN
mmetsp:Transcript_9872/g.17828  ORF Transcript_9872/g.17828 Transcript_9872/m.17828 type:complete len:120 (-) Transcript_9872:262-621(-)|eukprot:CAMPEP_0201608696 /NCGR_PEP_ID=MMETSP0492-20130828/8672_1 /ASSEMBLY_ACC=CAM_ASM_000837 /TAXON_ID=420259 /ORGANISM="Thalassiosira gravida, Strain GMp14c1" /LENGTH=119 /DNA_ID=CAMNT_0048073615 /DNA_START=127 /DNA_END=486 /DNA_ORIENTATION=-